MDYIIFTPTVEIYAKVKSILEARGKVFDPLQGSYTPEEAIDHFGEHCCISLRPHNMGHTFGWLRTWKHRYSEDIIFLNYDEFVDELMVINGHLWDDAHEWLKDNTGFVESEEFRGYIPMKKGVIQFYDADGDKRTSILHLNNEDRKGLHIGITELSNTPDEEYFNHSTLKLRYPHCVWNPHCCKTLEDFYHITNEIERKIKESK